MKFTRVFSTAISAAVLRNWVVAFSCAWFFSGVTTCFAICIGPGCGNQGIPSSPSSLISQYPFCTTNIQKCPYNAGAVYVVVNQTPSCCVSQATHDQISSIIQNTITKTKDAKRQLTWLYSQWQQGILAPTADIATINGPAGPDNNSVFKSAVRAVEEQEGSPTGCDNVNNHMASKICGFFADNLPTDYNFEDFTRNVIRPIQKNILDQQEEQLQGMGFPADQSGAVDLGSLEAASAGDSSGFTEFTEIVSDLAGDDLN